MHTTAERSEITINIKRIRQTLWKKKMVIVIVSILCAIIAVVGASLTITPQYQADILVYVNNHSVSLNSAALTFSSGELTAARQLLNTYIVALQSRTVLNSIIEKAGLSYSRSDLSKMISAGSVNNTEWFTVKVIAGDPNEARIIADTVAEVLPDVLSNTIEGSSVKILDYAVMPQGRVNPGYGMYAGCGFFAGLALIVIITIIKEILNDKIHGEDTLTEISGGIPLLASIPHRGHGGSYSRYEYGYQKNSKSIGQKRRTFNAVTAVCDDLDFAQTEAYNLLQTSVQYSFSENNDCKVIGITSSERNEGKSTLAINLAYSLSCDKKNVLLLEGDMRLPSIAKKLKIDSRPGLSDYLTGKISGEEGIQFSTKAPALSVMCAGVLPPNPFMLLGSESMERFLAELRKNFDFIIVDLPPVNIVSDPVSIAKYLDGFIVVARSEFSTSQGVLDVIRKLQVVNANILGFVLNSNDTSSGNKYGKYGRYEKYAAKDYETIYKYAARKAHSVSRKADNAAKKKA